MQQLPKPVPDAVFGRQRIRKRSLAVPYFTLVPCLDLRCQRQVYCRSPEVCEANFELQKFDARD